MNIILPIIYHAQTNWLNIIEPSISKKLTQAIVLSKNNTTFSFQETIKSFLENCKDDSLKEEFDYIYKNTLQDRDKAAIYFDHIYSLLKKYCHENNISFVLKNDSDGFEFSW